MKQFRNLDSWIVTSPCIDVIDYVLKIGNYIFSSVFGIYTFCTRFCENESNLKVIQEIMGHADIETTMNIYAEATTEKKVESFANLEGKIKIS